ncbi:MAG: zinc-finger domain-containing protein [Gammaproteobacteria bacterium]|nr:zinc-finger domain-containing protein [Gammaproteobacteria bacterium]MCP5137589.1 zinc-finger domain-containing protein [Gammaproteobacteria bacterium]
MSTAFNANHNATDVGAAPSNNELRIEVSRSDLPVHCPMPGTSAWNSHPRVYIPLEEGNGRGTCPYCGTEYILR